MRKEGRDLLDVSSESSVERDEPDWDYAYDPSTTAKNHSSSTWSVWDDGSNSIVAPPSLQTPFASSKHDETFTRVGSRRDSLSRQSSVPLLAPPKTDAGRGSRRDSLSRQASLSSITQQKATTRKLTSLEILCANHQCALQQEPQQTYYQSIPIASEKRTPEPPKAPHRRVTKKAPSKTSERKRRDDNHIRRAMERNLVDSAMKKSPVSAITFKPQEEKEPPPACAMPSFFNTTAPPPPPPSPPPEVPTVVTTRNKRKVKREGTNTVTHPPRHTNNNDKERTSPTSVDDIVGELTDLQEQLDALRTTQPTISREALMDAAVKAQTEELVQLPKLDEQLVDGLPFQAADAQEEASENTAAHTFADFVNALHRHVPPVLEESFVDEGVRMRHFDSDEEATGPKSSIRITIAELESSPESSPPRNLKSKSEASAKDDSKERSLSSDRDAPESLQLPKQGPKLWSPPVPGFSKKKSKSRSSCSTSTTSDSFPQKNKSAGFSFRSALASMRKPKTVTVSKETIATSRTGQPGKSVRFSKKLVTSMHYRPKTLPHEQKDLYFSQEELDELERDREQRIYEEQFEVVAGPELDVAVTYPARRAGEKQQSSARDSFDGREPLAPELVDTSGSWSSSEAEGAHVFEI